MGDSTIVGTEIGFMLTTCKGDFGVEVETTILGALVTVGCVGVLICNGLRIVTF